MTSPMALTDSQPTSTPMKQKAPVITVVLTRDKHGIYGMHTDADVKVEVLIVDARRQSKGDGEFKKPDITDGVTTHLGKVRQDALYCKHARKGL